MLSRLDVRERGPRPAARDELAIDEERVGRAIDEIFVRPRLERDPRADERPLEQCARSFLVGDGNPGEPDRFLLAAAIDDERA
ncbi:MAG TPA: hypothetical protein VHK90_00390, partial [Thermoanaerobaculia bacterium]|nr:hypothetical protein [Thermoanaerobaculia bacterium]